MPGPTDSDRLRRLETKLDDVRCGLWVVLVSVGVVAGMLIGSFVAWGG